MDILIPMAGRGERFLRAGWGTPKPLIPVDGVPMVERVVKLFPGSLRVVMVVADREHQDASLNLEARLRALHPGAEVAVIDVHHDGPVHTLLAAAHSINDDAPVLVAMCDLGLPWDFQAFRRFTEATDADGVIVGYRGFHPHLLRSTRYAWVRDDPEGRALEVREKGAFSDAPMQTGELCSNGIYWFRSGAVLKRFAAELATDASLRIDGEHYVSLVYRKMLDAGCVVRTYDTPFFFQWGSPEDLQEWSYNSEAFQARAVPRPAQARRATGTLLMPAAGLGLRFSQQGYVDPKPLLPVCDRPMLVQATADLPRMARTVFVTRADAPGIDRLGAALQHAFPASTEIRLDGPTDGQARTCVIGVERAGVPLDEPLVIGACDNGTRYDCARHDALLAEADMLVWAHRGYPAAAERPEHYGWLDVDPAGVVRRVSVKQALGDPTSDPMVIGAFSFRVAGDLLRAAERLFQRKALVRGEFYLDTLIEDALALGMDVRAFEIDGYEGWGTPNELASWRYWQRAFDAWPDHPYRVSTDARYPPDAAGGC